MNKLPADSGIPCSWWERRYWENVDIVVAGAGITGLQVADVLKRRHPQLRVVILDRDPLALGASSRNAGFACFGSLTEFVDDMERGGTDAALELAERRYRGLLRLRDKMGDASIGFHASGSLEIFTSREAQDAALEQLPEVNRLFAQVSGLPETLKAESTTGLQMCTSPIGIRNVLEGTVETHSLLSSLRKRALEAGVEIYGGMEIVHAERLSDGMELQAGRHTIRARQVVWCTNAWAGQFLEFDTHQPARGQVLVTAPMEPMLPEGAYFFNAGYTYFRTLGRDRLLLGGFRDVDLEAENNFSPETGGRVWEALDEFLRSVIFPSRPVQIEMAWAGTMSMGRHRAPRVERADALQVLCAGMSGMGVALSAQVAEDAAEIVAESF